MARRFGAIAVLLGLVGVGCGTAPSADRALDGVLYVATSSGLAAVDAASGAERVALDGAIPTPDWAEAYVARPAGDDTLVERVSLANDGKVLAERSVAGDLRVSVASQGTLVALTEPRSPGATPWLPDGRARSRLVIADLSGEERTRSFELEGNFEPEAFSTNERELFMIEYVPAMDPDRYRVRRLKLDSGAVVDIGPFKLAAPDEMRGTGRMQVFAPDGARLYTLYTRQGLNYAHGETAGGSGHVNAFVHVLDLHGRWAHCVDLPEPFGSGSSTASAIALARDGRSLYVADWTNGAIAQVGTKRLKVLASKRLRLGGPDDSTFATTGPDGRVYVAGNSQVAVVDGTTLEEIDRFELGTEVAGLVVSEDGSTLYAGTPSGVAVVDARTGARLGYLSVPGSLGVTALAHP
jgi:hypothetical protein